MRLNQFIARHTGMSRREADRLITDGRITLNGQPAKLGSTVKETAEVKLDGKHITQIAGTTKIILNKPPGYVCSRRGQGNKTVYDLIPIELHKLKPVGRLDKDSSGLLLLTSDGELANRLTHPRYQKTKVYEVEISKPLIASHQIKLQKGVMLEDGLSSLQLKDYRLQQKPKTYIVRMHEGRKRQIRRTFDSLGYKVTRLHRTQFGTYKLSNLSSGKWKEIA